MVKPSSDIPRVVQSDLHDIADELGEKIATGQLITIDHQRPADVSPYDRCTCGRYSMRNADNKVVFWNEPDPNCKYVHLAPLKPQEYVVPL